MFRFLKKKEPTFDREVFERFKTHFGILRERRFPVPHEEGAWSSHIRHRTLMLELWKSHCFSWLPADYYLYRNFMFESSFSFDPENNHSACGFIFRFVNNENFYYFLVSNKGYFRFDVLFNGNPLHLIEWTHSPHIAPERVNLRVIAHDTHFSFFIDDEWVAEIDDESLQQGRIGIAGQNYGEEEKAVFHYHDLILESRPVEVELSLIHISEPTRPY